MESFASSLLGSISGEVLVAAMGLIIALYSASASRKSAEIAEKATALAEKSQIRSELMDKRLALRDVILAGHLLMSKTFIYQRLALEFMGKAPFLNGDVAWVARAAKFQDEISEIQKLASSCVNNSHKLDEPALQAMHIDSAAKTVHIERKIAALQNELDGYD